MTATGIYSDCVDVIVLWEQGIIDEDLCFHYKSKVDAVRVSNFLKQCEYPCKPTPCNGGWNVILYQYYKKKKNQNN
jgi:hypothetical protein